MEAFSDGVIAIIITIMVPEVKVPEYDQDLNALIPLAPFFLSCISLPVSGLSRTGA